MNSGTAVATITLNPAVDQTITIDNFQAGAVNRVQDTRVDAGGKGVNVAAFVADYGLEVAASGYLGTDNAALFEKFFARKKIEDHFVRIGGSIRTGIKIVDRVNNQTTDINFPGIAPSSNDLDKLFGKINELGAQYGWFVLAGSLPATAPVEIYQELVRAVTARGAKVALDTSGEGFRRAVSTAPTLIKPNINELQEYCGCPLKSRSEIIDAAQELLELGIETVVVSMGEEGALFIEEEVVVQAIPPAVTVQSTVGAGDAMVSGLVVGKIEHRQIIECARLSTAFSVIAVSNLGAGIPSLAALHATEARVEVIKIRGQ
jgi:1-phosphofructokinase